MVLKVRQNTVKEDINRIFKNSMVTGISQIVKATNWKKKIVRSLIFVICVLGFIYQSLKFMKIYWKYETVVDVQVYSPLEIDKPAYTICGEFGFMSSKFCPTVTPEFAVRGQVQCEKVRDNAISDYCYCHKRLCTKDKGLKNISLITEESIDLLFPQPWDWVKQYVATDKEYISSCSIKNAYTNPKSSNCTHDNSVTVPYPDNFGLTGCFTRDSLYENPDGKPEKVLSFGDITIELNTLEIELPLFMKDRKMFISFHSPYTVENPMKSGFTLERNHRYKFRLSKVIRKLLPYPYETDCIDYLKMWKARGGKGPTNLKECTQECLRNHSLEMYGCVKAGINYPGFDKRCPKTIKLFEKSVFAESQGCIDKCKPACYEEYFVTTSVKSKDPISTGCVKPSLFKERADFITVQILYSGMKTTVYKYSPKYEDIEIFSYVGGYMGMWLGISLILVFDFLETVVMLMHYPLKRLSRLKQKQRANNLNGERITMY